MRSRTYKSALALALILGAWVYFGAQLPLTREQKLALAPNSMNVPIRFYGRILDQDGNPLPGVRVVISVRRWNYVAGLGVDSIYPKSKLMSDTSGGFQFNKETGDLISIESLEKSGYQAEPKTLRSFGYNTSEHFSPDSNSPIVFRMWKAEMKQPLVTGEKFSPIIPDGRVYTMDLIKGTFTEGKGEGDLNIKVKRSPNAHWGEKYDWTFDFSSMNGGLREETNQYESMFLAPQNGYAQNLVEEFHPGDRRWANGINKRFYLRARNGDVYGRLDVEIDAFYLKDNQGRFGISFAVNTNGSPVLR